MILLPDSEYHGYPSQCGICDLLCVPPHPVLIHIAFTALHARDPLRFTSTLASWIPSSVTQSLHKKTIPRRSSYEHSLLPISARMKRMSRGLARQSQAARSAHCDGPDGFPPPNASELARDPCRGWKGVHSEGG